MVEPQALVLGPGSYVLVEYPDEPLWHERLLLASAATPAEPMGWVVLTPDLDMYLEQLAPPDVLSFRIMGPTRALPLGVRRDHVYGFTLAGRAGGVPTAAELAQLQLEATGMADAHRAAAGAGGAAVEAPPPAAMAPPPLAPPAGGGPLAGAVAPAPAAALTVAVAADAPALGGAAPPAPAAGVRAAAAAAEGQQGLVLPTLLAAPVQPAQRVWRAAESRGGLSLGDPVDLPAGVTVYGDRATLMYNGIPVHIEHVEVGAEAQFRERREPAGALDCRILRIRRDTSGKRRREWRDLVDGCSPATFDDFPLPGERTASWCLAHVDRHHGGMEQHHALFKTVCKLQLSDWGVELHEALAGILHLASSYDQLDLTNVAWAESALRTMQSVEFVYQERLVEKESIAAGSRLTLEERSAFTGAVRPGQQLMVCPSLLEHVKKEAERTGGLLKELRKAREEREARKPGGGKK